MTTQKFVPVNEDTSHKQFFNEKKKKILVSQKKTNFGLVLFDLKIVKTAYKLLAHSERLILD